MLIPQRASVLSLLIAAALLAGCDREEAIISYNAPKDSAKPVESVVTDAPGHSQEPQIHWSVPAGWKELPAQEMRYAAYSVAPDDPSVVMTVIPLGQAGGQLLPNVNRWEQQLGLPPTPEADLNKIVKRITVSGMPIDTVDLIGPKPADGQKQMRMLAAILPQGQRVWFFKLVGPAEIVAAQKSNFDALLQSIHFDTGEGHGPAVTTLETWTTPPGWQQDRSAIAPRVLSFQIGAGEQKAEVVVTKMESQNFGSIADNINRWRGQVGLEPTNDLGIYKQERIALGQAEGVLFDVVGPESAGPQRKRLLAVLAVVENDVWFFKIIGPAAVVAEQRPAFETFLKSVRFTAQAAH